MICAMTISQIGHVRSVVACCMSAGIRRYRLPYKRLAPRVRHQPDHALVRVAPRIDQIDYFRRLPGLDVERPVPLLNQALRNQSIEPGRQFLLVHRMIVAWSGVKLLLAEARRNLRSYGRYLGKPRSPVPRRADQTSRVGPPICKTGSRERRF